MDHGLSRAVEAFVARIGAALQAAGVSAADSERQAVQEAYNLCVAFIDADGRHTDDELWALVERFAPLGQLRPETTPELARANDLAGGKRQWLEAPSALFEVLRDLDAAKGTGAGPAYQELAIDIGYAVAALDQYPSSDEIGAITALRRTLADALASPRPVPPGGPATAPAGSPPGTGVKATADQAAAGATPAAPEEAPLPPAEKLEDLLAELDRLIGLQVVKDEVHRLAALLRVQKLREERGLPVVDTTNHLIFSGNPGTGKTTVARLLARIYRSLGVVAKGQYLEVDRSELVAGFVGQTAAKVAEVFARADGGVLLIDEAYSLTRGGERDFGREAIDAVVKEVEDRRETMVVILAGYPREMAELVATNPGFESRFPKTIRFPDYSDAELVEILKVQVAKGGYEAGPEALTAAEAWFGAHPRGPGFGNGRLARNLFEAAVLRQALRLAEVAEPTNEQLVALLPADIASVPTATEAADGAVAEAAGAEPVDGGPAADDPTADGSGSEPPAGS